MGGKKGLLLDVTLCIGCGACYEACKERNGLPKTAAHFLQDQLYDRHQEGGRFVRHLCMHCEVPTCASVCPVAALEKTASGPVIYHEERCIGCRYCMLACPFGIPKYEWTKTLPRVRKCDLCADRIRVGRPTACAEVCPTGATKFGDRQELIEEAHARVRAHPQKYVPRVYGVEEVGGTSVLVLSDVPFERTGYRTDLLPQPLPLLTWQVLQKISNFVLVGSVLLGDIWWITNRRREVQRQERAEASSRPPQPQK